MNPLVKTIEDLSLNAWPSHQIEIYDGWLLRFSYFYTHRTNCVEQIGISEIPLEEKLRYTESVYRKWGTPCIFKISPLLDASFDSFLEDNGYVREHVNYNMVMNFPERMNLKPGIRADVSRFIPSSWIEGLFALKGTTNVMHRQVVPSMYRAIPKETVCVSIHDGESIIGTGLGILDRDYIGVYAIHVRQDFRRRGLARAIVSTILMNGKEMGASHAYLQVVEGNTAAIRLYESLGFRYLYTDSFRVKKLC
ncbi:GNAT family N-acetyltransferase [Bilifractor sp. HCP3S3_D3]|uniref:GNAT family N-acetyltransferase n=1 Tax=unclassified Bilifractor TaxID=2815795 RepID=UPI003F89C64D